MEKAMKFAAIIIILLNFLVFAYPENIHRVIDANGNVSQIKYYKVGSEIVNKHNQELRDSQIGIEQVDLGEEIIFVLDNGICVQFEDGSGRRLVISRGSGYSGFSYPAWSLDGKRMAFAANRTDPRIVDLVVANADGSDLTVILTLDAGYYNSFIQSISWHWGNEYIMFSYAYNDAELNSLFVICTIEYTGQNFVVGPGPDRNYCQYEPVYGSSRYAYIANGRPFYFHSDLRVSNLDGSNDVLWLQHTDVIAGLSHVCWNNANSIYTIIRNWNQYPNREALLRVDRSAQTTYYTVIAISELNASLWSPTLSPDRKNIYNTELLNNTGTLYLTMLGANGLPTSIVAKGSGLFPNWRQTIPVYPPDPPTLLNPPNNVNGITLNPVLSWASAPTATRYHLQVSSDIGFNVKLVDNPNLTSNSYQLSGLENGTKYYWRVSAINEGGSSAFAGPWSFTTVVSGIDNYERPKITQFFIGQNYPNPFNPVTRIEYGIPKVSHVRIDVYNTSGQHIHTLINEIKQAGLYTVDFNAENLASGIYIYRLEANGLQDIKKMVVMR